MSRDPRHFRSAPRPVSVAAVQMACDWDIEGNVVRAERLVREAAARGAQIILLPELFETPYFCIEQDARHLSLARTASESRAVRHFAPVARELGVVLPISFFERSGPACFNSIAILDADGTNLGLYRKSHIPNGPGYQEKNYFSPGDTGFKVWPTRFARLGVGICWDQWFPETARVMALRGAELLMFPTAIGTEPPPALPVNSREHWQRTQQGHAAANLTPLIASNRYGLERSLQDNLGLYRKSHIPNGPGYQEKNYFSPGDTGFKVWPTRFARLGVGICWDQWFPETARVMALRGAELLMFPTAIGTEPPPALPVNSREHWQRTQQGHAAANLTPLIASNRYGLERSLQDPEGLYIRFYGSSFIADAMGAKVEEAPEEGDAVLTHTFDLAEAAQLRDNWFVFRDRRPDLYGPLTSLDGRRTG
ncbi:MAG: hypothetical protein E6K33_09285 [Gammaproteobacteria bacterium]|nr:MAG: hypothetical protein E6K33_09285 [Gammaproteobacteria bacterium]